MPKDVQVETRRKNKNKKRTYNTALVIITNTSLFRLFRQMIVFLILRGAEIHKKISLDDNMIFVQTVHSIVITAFGKY
jgi:hypothetical protein